MSLIFAMSYMLVMFGLVINVMIVMLPPSMQQVVPMFLRLAFGAVGFILAIFGVGMVHTRAKKTGAEHLIEFAKPSTLLWFYVYRDGTVRITPAIREVEGQLYAPKLDAQINDLKSYRLFDHSIRFVPEGIGHAVDLDMVLYTTLLRNNYGFSNIREARKFGFKNNSQLLNKEDFVIPNNRVLTENDLKNLKTRV